MAHVMVVDDMANNRLTLALQLRDAGHQVVEADGVQRALHHMSRGVFDLVITDLRLGEGAEQLDGLELLRRFKRESPATEVIVITAYGTVATGVAAIKLGAHDYLAKPVRSDDLMAAVEQALETRRRGDRKERAAPDGEGALDEGQSRAWQELLEQVRKVAVTDATVLLTGESGTGKEVVAELIHARSRRAGQPMLKVNLGAVAETLQESELFGHVKGAFTGATSARKGVFMEATGSTLFLDEIGETAASTQVALLRVLAESEVRPVGGDRDVRVDVRVIAATNADLEGAVRAGRFREDLYFRVNVFPLRVPSLRERAADIPALARHLLRRHAARLHRRVPDLSSQAEDALCAHSWPGNVRELENVLERTLIVQPGDRIGADDLPVLTRTTDRSARIRTMADIEREHVLAVLDHVGGHRERAARLLGIGRATLFRRLKQYGV